jgi:hypothetical protein
LLAARTPNLSKKNQKSDISQQNCHISEMGGHIDTQLLPADAELKTDYWQPFHLMRQYLMVTLIFQL